MVQLTLGPPYETKDRLVYGGGVYRRLIWYKGRPVGWVAYGVNMNPNHVNLWVQVYRGCMHADDIVTYESEEAALLTAERVIKQVLGEKP